MCMEAVKKNLALKSSSSFSAVQDNFGSQEFINQKLFDKDYKCLVNASLKTLKQLLKDAPTTALTSMVNSGRVSSE